MTEKSQSISDYIVNHLAANIAVELLVRTMNAKLDEAKAENDKLRSVLAETDQLVEWQAKQLDRMKEALDTAGNALSISSEWTKWAGDEIARWRDKANTAITENDWLRDRVALLEKALESKPGMIFMGAGGMFLRGLDEETQDER